MPLIADAAAAEDYAAAAFAAALPLLPLYVGAA